VADAVAIFASKIFAFRAAAQTALNELYRVAF
jgi:hypothetical protein